MTEQEKEPKNDGTMPEELVRKREAAAEELAAAPTFETFWDALQLFQLCPFYTARGLEFTYVIRGNEMFVDRKEKSITRATVEIAFDRAMALQRTVTGPKKLGCFGASYLYPVLIRLGVIIAAP